MGAFDLAIELGTTHTIIYKRGLGVVVNEPSLVALQLNGKKREFKCVGDAAAEFIKNPDNTIQVYEPIVEGVIINKQLATMMLKEFFKKVEITRPSRLKVAISIPVGATQKDRAELLSLAYGLNFHSVILIPSGIASLVGMQVDLANGISHMVVNIGGGVSDISIITGGTIVRGGSVTIGGNSLLKIIDQYLREERSLIVKDCDKKTLLNELVSLYENDANELKLTCVDSDTKKQKLAIITAKELYSITKFFFEKLVDCIATMLNMSSSEVIADISRYGIYICGELCNITGLDIFLSNNLHYPIYIQPDSHSTTIYGLGAIIENKQLLELALSNMA